MITRPDYMDFKDWTSQLYADIPGVFFPIYNGDASGNDWKEWVRELFKFPELFKFQLPQPEPYSKWQDWADKFIEVVGV